jgi:hypothetical protein
VLKIKLETTVINERNILNLNNTIKNNSLTVIGRKALKTWNLNVYQNG